MKITMNFVTLFLLFRFSKFWVSAAVIGSQAQSHAINPLAERVVTYGLAQSDAAKFAVCNADQKKVLEQAMGEAAKLAKAGADGLAIILDMLSEERTEFNKLSETERNRYRETYFTFFGRIEDKSQWQLFRDRASFIKASLDRISPLTVETWPKTIVIFCDSSYYQLKDRDGNTSDQIPSLRNQVIPEQRQIMFDTDRNGWFAPYKQVNCSAPGSKIAGYTTRVTTSNSIKGTVPLDRITFCPLWFKFIKAPATGKSFTDLDPSKDIQQGTSMTVFETKAGLGYVLCTHHHQHYWLA